MNSKGHLFFSLAKSGIRIVGGLLAMKTRKTRQLAGAFVLAELLGVAEELVDKRN